MSIGTTPAIGSLTDCRSASIGADTWAVASRKITTSTSLDKISAITNVAHFPIQPRVWSHEAPARAMGANTMATNRRALRTSRLIPTLTAAMIAIPARTIVRIAAEPGALRLRDRQSVVTGKSGFVSVDLGGRGK